VLPRLAISAGALAVVAGALDQLGVAGYRHGALLCTLALPIAMGALAWLLTRQAWTTAVIVVVALALSGTLATRAPWSTGRLEAALDGLHDLDGFHERSTVSEGHSWCRPGCPRVTRTWDVADTPAVDAVRLMAIALSEAELAPPIDQLPREQVTTQLVVNGTKADAVVTAKADGDDARVTVVLLSHR
jgi:hypothetical protein